MIKTKRRKIRSEEEFEQILKQVLEYTLPPNSKTDKEVGKLIGLGRTTVYKYRKILKERGSLATGNGGRILKSKPESQLKVYEDILNTDFNEIPTVKTWIKVLEKTGVIRYKKLVANLWKVCKTINRHPDIFLDPILEAEKYKDEFVELFKQGKTVYINKRTIITPNQESNPKPYIDAIRSFRKANGKEIPKGMLKSEQKKWDLYRKIKFNDVEVLQLIEFMASKGEDFENLSTIHHEFGPRIDSLVNMHIRYEKRTVEVDGATCEYYLCNIYESKQDRHFTKIAFTPMAKKIIEKLPQDSKLHTFTDNWRTKQKYNEYLREFYEKIGRIKRIGIDKKGRPIYENYKKGTQEYYLNEDPSHAVRHSSVHWSMRCTGFKKDEVASMFWDKPDTLDEYDQITPDEIVQRGTCYYCKPPINPDPKWKVFCALNHAIAYHNQPNKK